MCADFIEETIEEPLECESGIEEHMRQWAIRQIEVDRYNTFKDKRCPVILH